MKWRDKIKQGKKFRQDRNEMKEMKRTEKKLRTGKKEILMTRQDRNEKKETEIRTGTEIEITRQDKAGKVILMTREIERKWTKWKR